MLTADSLRAAYLLGLAEIHLAGMIELVRRTAPATASAAASLRSGG
jgi:hypothetical protein